jgi:hypothetical protein
VRGVDRKAELDRLLAGRSTEDVARAHIDLTVLSVLLDAGAGPQWQYTEAGPDGTAHSYSRSEGLGVASLRALVDGRFSAHADDPCRVDAAVLARLLEVGCEEMPGGFSIKVRLGLDKPGLLLERLEVLSAFPLREVAVHSRTATQLCEGRVLLEGFAEALALCRHPVVYNGDIRTRGDFLRLKSRFPSVTRWMIGRGLAADPFLVQRLRGGAESPREAGRLKGFLDDYLAANEEELYGPASVLGRMKELWGYLHASLRQGERAWNAVKICRTLEEYRRVVEGLFASFPGFVDDAALSGIEGGADPQRSTAR